jgi:hypothetical protein
VAILAGTVYLAVDSDAIPLPLRVLPPVGWTLLTLATLFQSLVLAVTGLIVFGVGMTAQMVYGQLLGGSRRSTGRHGVDRKD